VVDSTDPLSLNRQSCSQACVTTPPHTPPKTLYLTLSEIIKLVNYQNPDINVIVQNSYNSLYFRRLALFKCSNSIQFIQTIKTFIAMAAIALTWFCVVMQQTF